MSKLEINNLTGKYGGLTVNNIYLKTVDTINSLNINDTTSHNIDASKLMSYDFRSEEGYGADTFSPSKQDKIIQNFVFSIKNNSPSNKELILRTTFDYSRNYSVKDATINDFTITYNHRAGYEPSIMYERFFFPIQTENFKLESNVASANLSTINNIKSSSFTEDKYDNIDKYKKINIKNIYYTNKTTITNENLAGKDNYTVSLNNNKLYILSFEEKESNSTIISFTMNFIPGTFNSEYSELRIGTESYQGVTQYCFVKFRKNKIIFYLSNASYSINATLYETPLTINKIIKE